MNTENQPTRMIKYPSWNLWKNPIFRRYCRSRLRPHGLGVSLLITFLISGFIVGMAYSVGVRAEINPIKAARIAVISLLILQSILLFLLGTAMVSGGMTAERDEGVIDYQRLLPLSPFTKIIGYLFGLPVREYVLFLSTLPFTAWALWRGAVPIAHWLPLYTVLFSSTLLYHFTGLLTGTIAKNRRWAFLSSISLVFCLYTVVPQMSNFGLVFFKYLTIQPVFKEFLVNLLPENIGSVLRTGQNFMPTAKFFGLNFSEIIFTLFSQLGLILTFIAMLCRNWRRKESHLLGKISALIFFIWIQVLLLGNALPLIESGRLFPSHGLMNMAGISKDWLPKNSEAVTISAIYGLFTLILIYILGGIITPSPNTQLRGWRRARKRQEKTLPWRSDAATSFGMVSLMALAGAAGWFLFTQGLVESRWFSGHEVPLRVFLFFFAVLFAHGVGIQSFREWKGGRIFLLVILLLGIVPLMLGSLFAVVNERMIPVATWLIGLSPFSSPFYSCGSLLSLSELPVEIARAVPRAFYFWLFVFGITSFWLMLRLRMARNEMAQKTMDPSYKNPAAH